MALKRNEGQISTESQIRMKMMSRGVVELTNAELLALVVRHQEDLLSRMNDEEKELFEKFADCTTEMHDLTEREAFAKGFTLGAKIIIEVMTTGGDE